MKSHRAWRKSVPGFCAVDVATANEHHSSACALGIARVARGRIVATARWLVRPSFRRFRYEAIHGIRWRDVKTAPTLGELWPVIQPWLQGSQFVAAHSAAFHKQVLLASLGPACGTELPPFLCTRGVVGFVWGTRNAELALGAKQLKIPLKTNDPEPRARASAEILLQAWKYWDLHIDCRHDLLSCCIPQCGA